MVHSLLYGQKVISFVQLDVIDKKAIKALVGKNLRRLRAEKKLTQDRLGGMLDPPIDGSHIAGIEAGRGADDKTLAKLCNALNVDIWQFYVTENAPILIDQAEKDVVQTFREARPLGCAEEIAKYSKFLVRDAKDMQKRMKKK